MIGRAVVRAWPAAALLLAGCAGSNPDVGTAGPSAEPLRGLHEYIAGAVDDWDIAGLSIAVVKDGEVVFADGYGVREVGGGESVDENTLFATGSNTKLFTAVAAGMMVDAGAMRWNDRASAHLPGFQLFDPYVTREMTIRDLLSHRSGLGRRGDMLWYGSEYDRAELLRRIRYLEPNSSFRSEYGYQNMMFLAAGEAVAAAAGRSWDDVIEDRIFGPLGMRRSNTSTHDLAADPNVASPHIRTDGSLVAVPYRNIDNIAPAGSINSSAREMADWLRMLLAEGVVDGDTLVQPGTLREIFTPQTLTPWPADTLFPSVHFRAYGLGIVTQDYRGRKVLWHTGGIDGMLSLVGMVPEEDLGVVVLTNTTGMNDLFTALMYTVFDRYLGSPGEAHRDWSATLLRQAESARERMEEAGRAAEEERVTGTTPSRELDAYVGTYTHPMYGDAIVTLEDGALVLRRGPTFIGALDHWHYDTFQTDWQQPGLGSAAVTFKLDHSGEPTRMQVQGFDEFNRVSQPERGSQ